MTTSLSKLVGSGVRLTTSLREYISSKFHADQILYVEEMEKKQRLMDLLLEQPPARTLVFVKSKRACDSLDDYLYNLKFPCTSIHGDRTQREREAFPCVTFLISGRDDCFS
jgi:superfamily II DNA/RNA helicase